jgi:peptidoglycan/LPS O-acetylase OafA/YrhL
VIANLAAVTISPPAAVLAGRPALHFAVIYRTKGWLVPHQDAPALVRAGLAGAYLAVLLAASWACYRRVEVPFQRLGRRLVKRLAHPA